MLVLFLFSSDALDHKLSKLFFRYIDINNSDNADISAKPGNLYNMFGLIPVEVGVLAAPFSPDVHFEDIDDLSPSASDNFTISNPVTVRSSDSFCNSICKYSSVKKGNASVCACPELYDGTSIKTLLAKENSVDAIWKFGDVEALENPDEIEFMSVSLRGTKGQKAMQSNAFLAFLARERYFDALDLLVAAVDNLSAGEWRSAQESLFQGILANADDITVLEILQKIEKMPRHFGPTDELFALVLRVREMGFNRLADRLIENFKLHALAADRAPDQDRHRVDDVSFGDGIPPRNTLTFSDGLESGTLSNLKKVVNSGRDEESIFSFPQVLLDSEDLTKASDEIPWLASDFVDGRISVKIAENYMEGSSALRMQLSESIDAR